MQEEIVIKGAKTHNLKNISLSIPKNKFVVITGVSGSGKSSLAFDTLYAEGQRRYVESLSSYARQFLGLMEKPDVESITGLSPAISIDQKTSSSNPRSTVGTVTEIYDYLRLLYTQIGEPHCPNCGRPIQAQTIQEIVAQINTKLLEGKEDKAKLQVLAPIVQAKKGSYKDLFDNLLSKGFLRVSVDGEVYSLDEADEIKLDKNKKHSIDLVIDRLVFDKALHEDSESEEYKSFQKRLNDAIELSSSMADGEVKILIDEEAHFYSESNTCFSCKLSFPKLKPASFSFNSPHGACQRCSGIGSLKEIDVEKIYNPRLSILEGGIFPWSNRTTSDSWTAKILQQVAVEHKFSLKTPIGEYPKEILDLIFYGTGAKERYRISYRNKRGELRDYDARFEGVVPEIERRYLETTSNYIRAETEKYMVERECSECHGARLKPYPLSVKLKDKNINELSNLQINDVVKFFKSLDLKGNRKEIADPISRELITRLTFLLDVGLDYLTLDRRASTLSGGESQRIRLASQIGTGLTGVLYVLDEPSIGLHSRDVDKLIKTLENLRDIGNSVVVVEHDYDTISRADHIVDIGPGAGVNGGEVVAEGVYKDFMKQGSLTAQYLLNKKQVGESLQDIENEETQNFVDGKRLVLKGVKTHNLKSVDLEVPLGKFVSVTGVSGSGKSSLVNDTLYPILMNEKMNGKQSVGEYESIEGLEHVQKVIGIDQSPIGRTPRSNPVTYIGAFQYIRDLFAMTPEARARGYTPGRFSFNVKGGRCEKCQGNGQIKVEMQFLADMYITCEECGGKRYNKEALQIDYKGKNISEVLDMSVAEAREFFSAISNIKRKLDLLSDVGLDYIKLGQYATTLSGGESQRIKLARELTKMVRGHTMYILDEPTTGLHFADVDKLLIVLKKLVNKNNTVLVIEHNMDIIRYSDWIIDLGPDGGDKGGLITAQGSMADIIAAGTHTGNYLKEYLDHTS
ncbi:MAG: excinuclease ABC subunit UvrA [Candidatus Dojkabacteria bacterium]|nr:MAG: excinuclease ABC subunit UvrA [Candidatus Dojkabacteria bacterium]